ncbi:MAG: hypothetical protein PGN29_13920 [Gordonia paraffinivorans]
MTVDAATTHRDAPPPIDLAGHFRDLARMLLPALLIGVIVGGAVFAYLSAQTKQYSASVVTQVTTQGEIVAGDAFVEQLRAPFQELATDDGVLAQVLTQVSTGWTTGELSSHVTLTPGTAPSLLTFTATADSPRTAQQVARAMVAAVAQANEANAARDVARRVDQIDASIAFEQARNGRLAAGSDARTQSDARLAELRAQRDQIAGAGGNQLTVFVRAGGVVVAGVPETDVDGAGRGDRGGHRRRGAAGAGPGSTRHAQQPGMGATHRTQVRRPPARRRPRTLRRIENPVRRTGTPASTRAVGGHPHR